MTLSSMIGGTLRAAHVTHVRMRDARGSTSYVVRMPLDGARVFHVNVNCSDLDRSRAFYAGGLGLDASARTTPDQVQSGEAFGLTEARWDAWILCGERGFDGGAIDLLEWKVPRPAGTPPARLYECGFQRIGFMVPDLDAALGNVTANHGQAWSEPFAHANDDGSMIRLALVSDPDDTAIELIEGGGPRLSFVGITCTDFEQSLAFYRTLGFRLVARFPSNNDDGAHLRIDGPVAMEEAILSAPGGGDVLLMLVGFATPSPTASPPRPANTLGMWRTAMLVPDLDAATAVLDAAGVGTISPSVSMAMGLGLPTLRFVCFKGPDGEVLELIEQPAAV
jgi:catechol 2,3-dioxygenase-like lactoylglutathione lyase family enzyme